MGDRSVTAVLEFAREYYAPEQFRVYILEWNERSRKVAERQGFAVEAVLETDEGPSWVMAARSPNEICRTATTALDEQRRPGVGYSLPRAFAASAVSVRA
jgi:RimJ/RimL family protein N-acetyltransferase